MHYQEHDLTYEQFRRDASALVDAITAVRRHIRPQTGRIHLRVPWDWIGWSSAAASMLILFWVLAHPSGLPVRWPWQFLDAADRLREGPRYEILKQPKDELAAAVKENKKLDPIGTLVPGSAKRARDLLERGSMPILHRDGGLRRLSQVER